MRTVGRVLVGVDFSAAARAAFDQAVALSREPGAELSIVHAVTTDWPSRWHARERQKLIESLRAAAKAAGVRFKIRIESGDPASVILRTANAGRAGVIVLGASERTGFDRFRFGSVAETVAVEAAQPVLVIPAGTTTDPGAGFRSIVVAVDLSDGSTDAVAAALSMAGPNTRVTVVHVIPGVPMPGAPRYMYHLMEPEYQRRLAQDAWRRMPEMIPAKRSAPRVHTRVATGDPTAEILRVARESDADLILVGVRPRGVIGRLLFGSTAARVIRGTGVPVLAMPPVAEGMAAPPGDDEAFAAAA